MEHRHHLTNLHARHFVIRDYMNKNYEVGVASKSTPFTSNFVKIGHLFKIRRFSPTKTQNNDLKGQCFPQGKKSACKTYKET